MGFQYKRLITYMEENGLRRKDLTKLPGKLHCKPQVIRRLSEDGIIREKERIRGAITWKAGPHYFEIMKRWKEEEKKCRLP